MRAFVRSGLKSDFYLDIVAFINFNGRLLKVIENAFYCMLKAFFVLKIFRFLSGRFLLCKKAA